jgi:hypothetical protein
MNGEESEDDSGFGDSIMARLRTIIGKPGRAEDIAAAIENGDGQATRTLYKARREMI